MRFFKKMMALYLLFFPLGATMASQSNTPPIYTEDKPVIMVTAKQPEFMIKLKSNATTGFSWFLRSYDATIVQPVKESFEKPENSKLIGAAGNQIWVFKVKPNGFTVPMQTMIRFAYTRPWETDDSAHQVVFQVTTRK